MKKLINQILKFGVVGSIAFIIDYSILFVCTEFIGIYYLISSLISFLISTFFNYKASMTWIFNSNNNKNSYKKSDKFCIFFILSIIGLLINQSLMYLGSEIIRLHYMMTKIIATIVVMFFNFFTRQILFDPPKNKFLKSYIIYIIRSI